MKEFPEYAGQPIKIGSNQELELINHDWQSAFWTLASFVAEAHAAIDAPNQKAEHYIEEAYQIVQNMRYTPVWQIVEDK